MRQIIFVTGTDTGVGKTLLTALLLVHLRQEGRHALAMKPFCSGSRDDARVLRQSAGGEIGMEEVNPFYFPAPVAPLVGGRRLGRTVELGEVVAAVRSMAARCEVLLVEGVGGLLVPLGPSYTVADLIFSLRCPVILVARNRLGAVNHTLLTLGALRALGVRQPPVVFMDTGRSDLAALTNPALVSEWSPSVPVFRIPFLGQDVTKRRALERSARFLKKRLAKILRSPSLVARAETDGRTTRSAGRQEKPLARPAPRGKMGNA